MGARSFAKLALFDQNDPNGELKPIPRPLPSRNHRWSSGEEFSDDDKILDSDSEPESSDDDSPKPPPKRLRFAAANAIGNGPYNNPDESDSDMSDGRSPTPELSDNTNGNAAAPAVNAGPVILPPSHTSGVPYRRGYVYPGLDFDNIMTFPPDPSLVNPNVRRPRVAIPKPKKPEMKEVPMNFTDDAETPHMSFVMRRAQALAEAEQEARHPGYTAKATAKKVRRRTDTYVARPKRAYNWKTENKNKKKRYEENGFMGRAADREKALEKALQAELQAKEAAKEFRRLEKLSRLNTNGKRDREASKEEDDE
ncbi:hypothetical protein BDZ45DRAFT_673574 [Acephala macrosclerotiorum]|nr:hypothetical protein BDZ45DRAFT_673574 [Acephala macrosclerotiorum]